MDASLLRAGLALARALPLVLVPFGPRWGRVLVALLLAATAWPQVTTSASWTGELAVGAVIALCAAVPLYAAQAAGLLVARDWQGTHLVGRALPLLLLATVAAAGGVGGAMRGWLSSYALVPSGTAQVLHVGAPLLALGGRAVTLGVTLALPFLGALALVELVLGFVVDADQALTRGVESLRPVLLACLIVAGALAPSLGPLDLSPLGTLRP